MGRYIGLKDVKRVHFIGIGGVSMSGLAEILVKDGFIVSGSDWNASAATHRLRGLGINVAIGPNDANNITADMDLVVYTAAVKPENPERVAAEAMGIPIMVRAELLGVILQGYEYAICVAGSHGKTSTTALISTIAQAAGLDPTVNIGGYIAGAGGNSHSNYLVGNSPYFILEACEYSNSFHHWHPYVGVILNIDADHLDYYGSMEAIIDAFAKFARNIRPGGTLIIQEDIQGFDKIVTGLECEVITFSTRQGDEIGPLQPSGDLRKYWIRGASQGERGISFDIMLGKALQARVDLPLPGDYNMYNALAAFVVAGKLGIESHITAAALSNVVGVKRRYEYKGEFNGATIIDDYAHHPTEIKACLAAARQAHPGRIICLFQPHTYTRTRDLFEDFVQAFTEADVVVFIPIYAAREPFDPSISSAMLAESVAKYTSTISGPMNEKTTINCNNMEEAEELLRGKLMPQDLLITMGAGDVYFIGEGLLGK